jgi:hypothetical protein
MNNIRRQTQTAAAASETASGDSVTVRPPFDPEEFARNAESGIRLMEGAPPPPLPPTMPPPAGLPEYPVDLGSSPPPKVRSVHPDAVPALAVAPSDLDWFELSPRVRQLLYHVNGRDSVATICGRSGLEPAEGIDILVGLALEGIISTGDTPA